MRLSRLVPALAALALSASPAASADLTKIDRAIAKEPAYKTKNPKYCLLVFGPEAKTRVWVVDDGGTVYVDRNCNGDLTDDARTGDIVEPDGKTKHTKLVVRTRDTGVRVNLKVRDRGWQYAGWDEDDPLRFAGRPQDAPVVHFDGPLTMKLYGPTPRLVPGQTEEVNASVGTPGLGKGTFAAIQCCTVLDCKVAPVAEFEFPSATPGGTPVTVRVSLADD